MKYRACKPMFRKYKTNSLTETVFDADHFVVGKLVKTGITPQFKEGTGYGDNGIAEHKKVFNYADITLDATTIPMNAAVAMFGVKKVTASGSAGAVTYEDAETSESNYGCYGFVYGEVVDNKTTYWLTYLPRVKWDPPAEEYETEGENIVFASHAITGRAYMDETLKKWRIRQPFNTLDAALTALEAKIGGTLSTSSEASETIEDEEGEEPNNEEN